MAGSLFGVGKLTYDPTLGDTLGRKLVDAAQRGSIDVLLEEVGSIRSGRWDDRAFYVDLIAEHLTNVEHVEMLPDTALGNLIKGSFGVQLAWKARGRGTSETVTDEGWKVFFNNLGIAARFLLRAGEQDGEDPTPFANLQTAAMGLQLEREQAVEWLGEALKRDPYNRTAHFKHLTLLCEKWGGSHTEMFSFARNTVRKAPPGSILKSILYYALQEYYLYFKLFEDKPDIIKDMLSSIPIRDESLAIFQDSLQNRTIQHVSDYYPHNLAAWWFYILKIPAVVREETKKIGPHFTEFPWRIFYRDPAEAYQVVARF